MGTVTASVVPLRRLPPQLSDFTYVVPPALRGRVKRGSLVRIEFKKSLLTGIVTDTREVADVSKLKSIDSVLEQRLSEQQLHLARYLADYYVQSLGVIFNSFLVPPLARGSAAQTSIGAYKRTKNPQQTRRLVDTGYILYARQTDAYAYITDCCRRWQKSGKQLVIIAPELSQRADLQGVLERDGLRGVLGIPSKQQRGAFEAAWRQSRTASIVIGGMSALFLPFQNLKHIIVIESEHQLFHRAEQNPRYHLPDLLYEVADTYSASLLLTGFSPEVRLLHGMAQRRLPLVKLGVSLPGVRIIDRVAEQESGNRSWLSEAAADALEGMQGRALFFYNRHGFTRMTVCTDCGYTARCSRCTYPLIYEQSTNELVCVQCGMQEAAALVCPRCSSTALRGKGTGLERIVADLKKRFPQKKVAALSSRSTEGLAAQQADIVVATAAVFGLKQQSFAVGVMVNADLELHIPNYHAAESLRHTVALLRSHCDTLFVQTFDPGHYVFTTLDAPEKFYARELEWRRKLSYPPFGTLIKVWIREKDSALYRERKELLNGYFEAVRQSDLTERRDGTAYRATLILKLTNDLKRVLDLLKSCPYTWVHTEINPYDLH